jgi:hypothetical protein
VKYLSALLKGKNESMATLEEKASKAESQVIKIEENFRKRENERTRQFFFINKFDGGSGEPSRTSNDIGNKIARAGNMTMTNTGGRRIDSQQITQSQMANQ